MAQLAKPDTEPRFKLFETCIFVDSTSDVPQPPAKVCINGLKYEGTGNDVGWHYRVQAVDKPFHPWLDLDYCEWTLEHELSHVFSDVIT
jgi:hypothetical protein